MLNKSTVQVSNLDVSTQPKKTILNLFLYEYNEYLRFIHVYSSTANESLPPILIIALS